MKTKKFLCTVMASVMLAQPFQAQAIDLGNAFKNIVSPGAVAQFNSPGKFQSGARTGYSGGGFNLRVPRGANTPALFSATMPSIQTGCGGISAHFGGFSFISGEEFAQLLKTIASGAALGFVSSLVMKTLCPPCEAVVQELKTAAANASKLARESCEWGAQKGRDALKSLNIGDAEGNIQGICSERSASTGDASDSLFSYQKFCNSIYTAADKLKTYNEKEAQTPEQKAAAAVGQSCDTKIGNRTWMALSVFDSSGQGSDAKADENYRRKLMLLNVMGASIATGGVKSAMGLHYRCAGKDGTFWPGANTDAEYKAFVESGAPTVQYCTPPVDSAKLVGHFMCGSIDTLKSAKNAGRISQALYESCVNSLSAESGLVTGVDDKLWVCEGADDPATKSGARAACPSLVLAPASSIFKGDGFLIQVNSLLLKAVDKVRNNQPYGNDDESKAIIGLIQAAPFPLYQAINAAAVYPAAAEDLINSLSILIAEQFAYAQMDEMLRLENRSSSGTACLGETQARSLLGFVEKFRGLNISRKTEIAQSLAVQQGLTEQIRQINQAIQRQVLSADMLGSSKYAATINRAVSGSNSGTGPATSASSVSP